MLTPSPPKLKPAPLPEVNTQTNKRSRDEIKGEDNPVGKVSKLEQKDDSSDDETWLVEDTTNEGDGKIYEGDDDDSDSDGDKYDMMTLNWDPATDKR